MEHVWEIATALLSAAMVGLVAWVFNTNEKIANLRTEHAVTRSLADQRDIDLKVLLELKFAHVSVRLERIEKALNGHMRNV